MDYIVTPGGGRKNRDYVTPALESNITPLPRDVAATNMLDAQIIAVLRRLHARAYSLADLEDVAPTAQREVDDWAPAFVAHPLGTLIKWGLVDAHQGSVPLTADEVLHLSR